MLPLILASLTFSISITAVVPAIPVISRELNVSLSASTWAFTGYLVASAALTPIVGHLGDAIGHRRVLLVVLSAFGGGAIVAGIAPTLAWVVVGRSIQGVGGAIIPLSLGIVRTSLPRWQRPRAVAFISATAGLGTGIGLLAGGVLVDLLGHHAVFHASGLLAFASLAMLLLVRPGPVPTAGRVPFDYLGAALLTAGIASLMVGISRFDLSAVSVGVLAAALLVATWTVIVLRQREARRTHPIISLGANASRELAPIHVSTLLTAMGGFPVFVLTPIVGQRAVSAGGLGLDQVETSLLLAPGCVLMMIAGACHPRLAQRTSMRVSVTVGATLIWCGVTTCLILTSSLAGQTIGIYLALAGIGLHLSAAANHLVSRAPVEQVAATTSVNALLRNIGNALGAQACTFAIALVISAEGGLDGPLWTLYASPAVCALLGVIACAGIDRRGTARHDARLR